MKKISKQILAIVLALSVMMSMTVTSFASFSTWDIAWNTDDAKAGITVFVGSNETERNFSWYSATESSPSVRIGESTLSLKTVNGTCVKAPDGDYANKVTVTGLKADTKYYYQCVSGDFTSKIYSFETHSGDDFSAIYVTDVHVTQNDINDENSLYNTSKMFNNTLRDALSKNDDISLVLSAGDQATQGLESEYKAYSVGMYGTGLSVATAIGNHDRKGVAYKTFTNMPNEDTESLSLYIGNDYWFVKGDVLFLVMDSNNGNGTGHASFIESAIKANPNVKWKVMMCHHDLYSGRIPHRESENSILRMIWGPLADEYGIDLVLLGHSHYYTVTNVLNNNKVVSPLAAEMIDPEGTIFMVSCSLGRARNDEEIGLNSYVGFDYLTENAVYNILDFTQDSITVNSYELGAEKAFNTFTIKKTTADGGHGEIGYFTSLWNKFVRTVGAVYTLFNNITLYSDLKDAGYDIDFMDCVFGR